MLDSYGISLGIKQIGSRQTILESDSKVIVKAINRAGKVCSAVDSLIYLARDTGVVRGSNLLEHPNAALTQI